MTGLQWWENPRHVVFQLSVHPAQDTQFIDSIVTGQYSGTLIQIRWCLVTHWLVGLDRITQHLALAWTASLAKWLRRPPRERRIGGSNPACAGILQGRVIPVTLALQWLPCQAPGVIGSVLGLVSPVSVYCDWVRWKVGSATSLSVWQHLKLPEQICPWDTLAYCWDVKQICPWDTLACCWDVKQICPWDTLACCWDVKQIRSWDTLACCWDVKQLCPWNTPACCRDVKQICPWDTLACCRNVKQICPWDTPACCWDVKQLCPWDTPACCWDVKQLCPWNTPACCWDLKQICPWDTWACWWDVKQPTNQRTNKLLPGGL